MPFARRPRLQWRLRHRALALGERTLLMAVINLTPDSFSGDGWLLPVSGRDAHGNTALAVEAACRAAEGGADLLDLGAESTRPGAQPLESTEEQDRLLPVLEQVRRQHPEVVLSVDTYHAATARAAVEAGADAVNDVSGLLWDSEMAATVAATGCGLVLMHTRGRPTEWRTQPSLGHRAMLADVRSGWAAGLAAAKAAGIAAETIVLDPGFGFGKLGRANFTLLAELDQLRLPGHGLLIGLSRKGFLGEVVRPVQAAFPPALPAVARRDATLAAQVAAILNGAHILRVHDLQPAREAAAVADAVLAEALNGD